MEIPVCVQKRHVHVSEKDCATLFGDALTEACATAHSGQHVYDQTVRIEGPEGVFDHVRVVGPVREKTQVELSPTDAYAIGIDAPVRLSGDLNRSGTCTIVGPVGTIKATSSVIIPLRHLHCSPQHAKKLGVRHQQVISVHHPKTQNVIDHVTVRVHPSFALQFELTADEAAEHWLHSGDRVTLSV